MPALVVGKVGIKSAFNITAEDQEWALMHVRNFRMPLHTITAYSQVN